MQSTICAGPCDEEKAVFPLASWGCQKETKKWVVKSVETLDQKVELDQEKGEFNQID